MSSTTTKIGNLEVSTKEMIGHEVIFNSKTFGKTVKGTIVDMYREKGVLMYSVCLEKPEKCQINLPGALAKKII